MRERRVQGRENYPAPHLCPRASARLSVIAPHGQRGASERLRPALPRMESRPAAARSVCSGSGLPQWGQGRLGGLVIVWKWNSHARPGNPFQPLFEAEFITVKPPLGSGLEVNTTVVRSALLKPDVIVVSGHHIFNHHFGSHHQSPYIHRIRRNSYSVNTFVQLFLED